MIGKLFKVVGWAIVLLIALLALMSLIAAIVYSPEYVRRVFAWRDSDVGDYRDHFPQRPLEAASTPFYFEEPADKAGAEARVEAQFEQILAVNDFETFLEETETQAFIVIQDDAILYEKYLNGAQRDTLMTSFSVAKSYASALIGIAIEEGYINSVDDPITDYLPELAERDPGYEAITIRHLLLMASGLAYQELRPGVFNSDDLITTHYDDQRQAALEFTNIQDPPGGYFSYNKYHPQLLGLILERSTGVPVADYLQEKIWDPLGMEFPGSWSIDSEARGFEKMETGVNARAIDYAKFGRLYLEGGRWLGEQVIPENWIEESTQVDQSNHTAAFYPDDFGQEIFDTLNGYYKYMWYGFFRDQNGRDEGGGAGEEASGYDFTAEGDRGQFIYVSPHKNLIIIRNGEGYGISSSQWTKAFYQFATEF